MINQLDQTLTSILDDPEAPVDLRNADISFEMPKENFAPPNVTMNLYLYDVRENRDLRDPVPIVVKEGDIYKKRMPALRVDCSYMVTAWSPQSGAVGAVQEHLLLSQGLIWLSQFPTLPERFLPPEWTDKNLATFQPFPVIMWVAQIDGVKEPGEFWAALGSPPRPSFNLKVTIAMDLRRGVDMGPPVATKDMHLIPDGKTAEEDHWFEIGGLVKDASDPTKLLANATVILIEKGWETITDDAGQFRFTNLEEGNYTLRASASGYVTSDKPIVVPRTAATTYDILLTPNP
jgi:hypothetical protein